MVDDADRIADAAGRPIVLDAVAVSRPEGRSATAPILAAAALVERPGLDAIVELIGGLEPAYTYIYAALNAGRQVITANNHVIAAQGPALAALGPLRFEASVASAIPIVEMLAETLAADRIRSIAGILNGTTNSMLEAMDAGASYGDALADAQRRGLAEADPSTDVDGHNPAAKLAILMMLAFRRLIEPAQIERVGIRNLDGTSREAGVVKLIAAAVGDDGSIRADVRPRLVPRSEPMAQVAGAMNRVVIDAQYAGRLDLHGLGAGPDAAASAVLVDVIRAAKGVPPSAGTLLASLAGGGPATVKPLGSAGPYPPA